MNPESGASRVDQIEQLVQAAAKLEGDEREDFLLDSCGDDPDLMTEVLDRLDQEDPDSDPAEAERALPGNAARFIDRFREELTVASRRVAALQTHEALYRELLVELRAHGATFGRYVLGRELGRGGMGIVNEAVDEHLRRRVAMKRILPEEAATESSPGPAAAPVGLAIRFLHEAQVTAQLDHPAVLPIHELGVDPSGLPFFTMPSVQGSSLAELLRGRSEASPAYRDRRLLEGVLAAARAMAHAHERHVVHRDLKPGNLMFGPLGAVYVMDWGVARVIDSQAAERLVIDPEALDRGQVDTSLSEAAATDTAFRTTHGAVVGTPAYMAPEQANSEPTAAHPRADIYSLGAILYTVLTGRPPFLPARSSGVPLPTSDETLDRLRQGPPEPIENLVHRAPPKLVAIAERAMARSPQQRFESMGALAADLEAYLDGGVVQSFERGTWANLRSWLRRNRSLAAAMAVSLSLAVLGVAGILDVQRSRERDAQQANREAQVRIAQLLRLSRRQDTERLLKEAEELWPLQREQLTRLYRWRDEAALRLEEQPAMAAQLAELEAQAQRPSPEARAARASLHPLTAEIQSAQELRQRLGERRDAVRLQLLTLSGMDPEGSTLGDEARPPEPAGPITSEPLDHTSVLDRLDRELFELDQTIEELQSDLDRSLSLHFTDEESGWWHRQLEQSLALLDRLGDPLEGPLAPLTVQYGLGIPARIAAIEGCVERSEEPAWFEAWDAYTQDSYAMGSAVFEPQADLLPLHRNPKSGLWEFAVWTTGSIPDLAPDGSTWVMTPDSCVILVQVEGGTRWIGSQRTDANEPGFAEFSIKIERPAHQLELDPFLISIHELTRAQWLRMAGYDNSVGAEITELHPANSLSWFEASETLRRFSLDLPTEAQWEHAARGGTRSTWWHGGDPLDAVGIEVYNFEKLAAEVRERFIALDRQIPLAPTSSMAITWGGPNPFGLFHVAGNVQEWCRDAFGSLELPWAPGTGERLLDTSEALRRCLRGGRFTHPPYFGRSAARNFAPPTFWDRSTGLRPARNLRQRQ